MLTFFLISALTFRYVEPQKDGGRIMDHLGGPSTGKISVSTLENGFLLKSIALVYSS